MKVNKHSLQQNTELYGAYLESSRDAEQDGIQLLTIWRRFTVACAEMLLIA